MDRVGQLGSVRGPANASAITHVHRGRRTAFGWAAVDQALLSGFNLVVGIVAARATTVQEFGAFSVGFLVYVLVVNASRSVTTEPLVSRWSQTDDREWPRAVGAAGGTALALGALGALGCLAAAAVFGGPLRGTLVAIAAVLPALLVPDPARYVLVARREG